MLYLIRRLLQRNHLIFSGRLYFPPLHFIGRRLFISSQCVLDFPAGRLVIQSVYLPIQGKHTSAFSAAVAFEHIFLQVEVQLPLPVAAERTVHVQADRILMTDMESKQLRHFPDGKRKILMQGFSSFPQPGKMPDRCYLSALQPAFCRAESIRYLEAARRRLSGPLYWFTYHSSESGFSTAICPNVLPLLYPTLTTTAAAVSLSSMA